MACLRNVLPFRVRGGSEMFSFLPTVFYYPHWIIKKQLEGEGRFLRAYTYFEMVKRFGGVPLVIKSYVYDENTPIENYQPVRETEAGIYDFIASEIDDIVSQSMLPETKISEGLTNGVH